MDLRRERRLVGIGVFEGMLMGVESLLESSPTLPKVHLLAYFRLVDEGLSEAFTVEGKIGLSALAVGPFCRFILGFTSFSLHQLDCVAFMIASMFIAQL